MKTYLLIHGAMHGGWCWSRVAPLLESAGHRVIAPDLPGHGQDKTPLAEVSLRAYVDRIVSIMETRTEPVILVGHSMAGLAVTQAAGQRPDLIRRLVYVTAHSINPGESLSGNQALAPDALGAKYRRIDPVSGGLTIDRVHLKEVYYNLCSDQDVAWAAERLVPQSTRLYKETLDVDRAVVDARPMNYIICRQDRAIPAHRQEQLAANWTMDRIDRLDSDHSPFLSRPGSIGRTAPAVRLICSNGPGNEAGGQLNP